MKTLLALLVVGLFSNLALAKDAPFPRGIFELVGGDKSEECTPYIIISSKSFYYGVLDGGAINPSKTITDKTMFAHLDHLNKDGKFKIHTDSGDFSICPAMGMCPTDRANIYEYDNVGSCKLIPANEATSAPALKKCLTSDNESVISGYFKKKEGTSVERRKFEFKSTGGDLFALTFTNVKGTKTCQYKKLAK